MSIRWYISILNIPMNEQAYMTIKHWPHNRHIEKGSHTQALEPLGPAKRCSQNPVLSVEKAKVKGSGGLDTFCPPWDASHWSMPKCLESQTGEHKNDWRGQRSPQTAVLGSGPLLPPWMHVPAGAPTRHPPPVSRSRTVTVPVHDLLLGPRCCGLEDLCQHFLHQP